MGRGDGDRQPVIPALLHRLAHAADWLGQDVLGNLLAAQAPMPARAGRWTGYRLRAIDATSICPPGAKGTTWRLHAGYDLASGQVDQLELTEEHGAESLTRFRFAANDIGLVDRGYARYRDLRELMDVGAHPLMRMGWNALALRKPDGRPFEMFAALARLKKREGEVRVAVQPGAKLAAAPPLILRLVMRRKTSQEAEEAQKRLRKEAGKRGKKPDPRSLEAAKYILILTSLPRRLFPTRDVLSLYRLRWQIELAFKRFKSLAGLDRLPAKNPDLARAWIYARLIAALMAERLAGNVPELSPLWIPQGRRYASRGGDASRSSSQASSPPSAVRSLGALSSKPSGVCGACCVNLRAADQHNRSIYEHAYVSAYEGQGWGFRWTVRGHPHPLSLPTRGREAYGR